MEENNPLDKKPKQIVIVVGPASLGKRTLANLNKAFSSSEILEFPTVEVRSKDQFVSKELLEEIDLLNKTLGVVDFLEEQAVLEDIKSNMIRMEMATMEASPLISRELTPDLNIRGRRPKWLDRR